MLRARKSGYTMKEVIEAVQNGESDFEMESDTSESSDEEQDKQNQAPIDCPTADDEEFEATKPSQTTYWTMPHYRYRWLKKDFTSPCTDFSGPDVMSGAVNLHTPLEYFQRFVSEDMIQALTENTNVYSLQKNGTCLNTCDIMEPFDIQDSNTTETCFFPEEVTTSGCAQGHGHTFPCKIKERMLQTL